MLDITVSDPEKHGTSAVNAFVDFKVHTRTDMPRFAARDFFVRRRYRDFVWLRGQLCLSYPGAIVPPLPLVDSLIKDDRFSAAFIQRRQAGLELFLRRVAASQQLSQSTELQTFLEAKVWELQTVKNASSGSWFSSIFDGTEASFKRVQLTFRQKVPDESAIEKLRVFAREYDSVVSTAAAKHHAFVHTLSEIASDLGQLGPVLHASPAAAAAHASSAWVVWPRIRYFTRADVGACGCASMELAATERRTRAPAASADERAHLASRARRRAQALDMLSQSETELSLPFTHMASALDRLKHLHLKRVQSEHVSGLSALLAFNVGMASALKEVLSNRDAALIQYQRSSSTLDSRIQERHKFQELQQTQEPKPRRSGMLGTLDDLMHDPQKGSKIDTKLVEAERDLASAKERWEAISGSIHAEAAAFHRQTNADFSRGLREHVAEQIDFQEAQQKEWRQLLEVFQQIETVPCGSFGASGASS